MVESQILKLIEKNNFMLLKILMNVVSYTISIFIKYQVEVGNEKFNSVN